MPSMLSPPLPDYGCIARWPEDGQGFIHPDDVAVTNKLIPSERVLRRDHFDGSYYHVRYGDARSTSASMHVVAGAQRRN